MKLLPPFSASSQKPLRMYDGSPTGALDAPERLTPLKRSVRPVESTKLPSTVCTKLAETGLPVVGETEGIRGM